MITHKGMSMLLKHHALDVEDNTDDDIKNCVDAAIKNSDDAAPEEVESGDEGDEVTNRAQAEEIEALKAKNAELEAKLKAKPAPLYNRADASQPNVEIEEGQPAEELERQQKISNRADELEKQGIPPIPAYNRAAAQFPKKNK